MHFLNCTVYSMSSECFTKLGGARDFVVSLTISSDLSSYSIIVLTLQILLRSLHQTVIHRMLLDGLRAHSFSRNGTRIRINSP